MGAETRKDVTCFLFCKTSKGLQTTQQLQVDSNCKLICAYSGNRFSDGMSSTAYSKPFCQNKIALSNNMLTMTSTPCWYPITPNSISQPNSKTKQSQEQGNFAAADTSCHESVSGPIVTTVTVQ